MVVCVGESKVDVINNVEREYIFTICTVPVIMIVIIPCLYHALAVIVPPDIRRRLPVTQIVDLKLTPYIKSVAACHGKHRLPSRNRCIDSTKRYCRTTVWIEEWNALGAAHLSGVTEGSS